MIPTRERKFPFFIIYVYMTPVGKDILYHDLTMNCYSRPVPTLILLCFRSKHIFNLFSLQRYFRTCRQIDRHLLCSCLVAVYSVGRLLSFFVEWPAVLLMYIYSEWIVHFLVFLMNKEKSTAKLTPRIKYSMRPTSFIKNLDLSELQKT